MKKKKHCAWVWLVLALIFFEMGCVEDMELWPWAMQCEICVLRYFFPFIMCFEIPTFLQYEVDCENDYGLGDGEVFLRWRYSFRVIYEWKIT